MRDSMATYSPDTIRILVSTDNHVGYGEHDGPRANDSWETFDEVLSLAASHDVDLVLLAGDLFHDNHPSRRAMMKVMESLRKHCQGDKPCAVDIIGDQTENFLGYFNRANYLDQNINISIPVFSIHGNHDDPTGADHTAALDLLHTAGLLNYYGHVQEADKIQVKPILMQKGGTKLALYGLSNVRDERLFQTFRDHKVTFFNPPNTERDWYNILSVHQNHTPHTDSSYLPESSLPSNMDMVIWGHEHECKIDPVRNPEMGFRVMQPGSTIATSLINAEAKPKHVAILNITGKDCKVETIRLKTVRPFMYQDIVLKDDKHMREIAHKSDNLFHVKKYCKGMVDRMIEAANNDWMLQNQDLIKDSDEEIHPPLPLIRLRVDYTPTETGEFKIEQNQRFSQEYRDRVANVNDVIQFHKKRTATTRAGAHADAPNAALLEKLASEDVKVSELVSEYLTAQSLRLLPQNLFSDAVNLFVEKGDKQAVENFVKDNLDLQVESLAAGDEDDSEDDDEDKIESAMMVIKTKQEDRFSKGEIRARKGRKLLPRPDNWDSDENGHWEDSPTAQNPDEIDEGDAISPEADGTSTTGRGTTTRGRGSRARGRAGRTTAASTRKTTAAKKAPASNPAAKGRSKKKPIEEDSESDVIMLSGNDEEMIDDDSDALFVGQSSAAPRRTTARTAGAKATTASKTPAPTAVRQSTLSFGTTASSARSTAAKATTQAKAPMRRREPSDDEIDDDDDAFETAAPVPRPRKR